MAIHSLPGRDPEIHESAFVAPSADIIGAVKVGKDASIWYNAVLRGDINRIEVGEGSNVQDGCVIHLEKNQGTVIGKYVTVGHKAMLHACVVEDECLIGMGSIVMDGAVVGARSIVGAGALVTMNTKIPPGSLVLGAPAKVIRQLSVEEQEALKQGALNYVEYQKDYKVN
ncbi:gamma carbonic anhydrase family protein [Sulfuriroseicoccus oceanibius]|uniref:Gamma carbonic anhydrase family protein n=1 Tax=Sulfuriroseicoccus oceanibius TaxID=2707525 RepID=A0A6B3LDL3_9BACT|nr:gamma carbonic anhydrase family protein [Sulfuriroseicoccus oceanibius]QQL45297.1 gamma carbonic anhydrase family protein [Sulfuriroseicoccus oceanibius]